MIPITAAVTDNPSRSRYELGVGEDMAFANYVRRGETMILTHTETPPHLRGRGVASRLVKGALDLIRADGGKVIAGCGFVADFLAQHPDYSDLKP